MLVGQSAQIKLAAYPFQMYGMLTGKAMRISADANEPKQVNQQSASGTQSTSESNSLTIIFTYTARIFHD